MKRSEPPKRKGPLSLDPKFVNNEFRHVRGGDLPRELRTVQTSEDKGMELERLTITD